MDDEISLAFMNPETAAELLKDNPDMEEAIVAAAVIPEGDVVVVNRDEFLRWLYEEDEDD